MTHIWAFILLVHIITFNLPYAKSKHVHLCSNSQPQRAVSITSIPEAAYMTKTLYSLTGRASSVHFTFSDSREIAHRNLELQIEASVV